jgi:SpoVK/Ycf46/Vps4 family AAA+-type ATPase
MQNVNRLIDDFKRQTKATVWKHLDAMAANYAVYSTQLNGLSPFLTDYDVYLYCNDTNMVVVCVDPCGHCDDNIFEETVTLSSMILNEGCEPRSSTVSKLAEAVRQAKIRLQSSNPDISVYGVLLTEATILNAYELDDMWNEHNVKVIDDLTRLKYRTIGVNEDDDLACKAYAEAIVSNSKDSSVKEPYEDEFAKLIDKFLDECIETVNGDEPMKSDTNAPEEEDDGYDQSCGDEDTDVDDSSETNTETEDESALDDIFPSGEVEQNMNVSVKVDVLRPIANPREELDKLVGCADIKRRMDELVALTSYNKMMREMFPDSRQHEVSLHSVFFGRPGTGKTTVCKIFGSLLRQAGALSKGHVVVCDRGTFIGTLWGDEERAMRQVLEMAQGGVLMIDEAYLLNGKNDNDPARLVVQLLMNVLADETQRDIAVVLCGYKDQMQKMLSTNPGLESRFPNKFEFTDFTVDELLEITQRRVRDYDYQFTNEAWDKYCQMLARVYQVRDPETWGNARFITNQLERIYIEHAARCVRQRPKVKSEYLMLTPEDIVPMEVPRQKTRIGF